MGTNTITKTKSFDVSIGRRIDQVALISHSNDDFTSFKSIKKGGRLSKIKRKFKNKLVSSTHFFFEGFTQQDFDSLLLILKK